MNYDQEDLNLLERVLVLAVQEHGEIAAGALNEYRIRIRPRLEKALKLLEQHDLLNSLDDGNAGFITPKER